MSDILVDVSHIIGWSGSLTGIERVEYRIIKHYYDTDTAKFICWEDAFQDFIDVSRDRVQNEILLHTSGTKNSGARTRSHTIQSRIINKIKRARNVEAVNLHGQNLILLAGLWDNNSYIEVIKKHAKNTKIIHVVYDVIPLTEKGYFVDYLPPIFEKYMLNVLPVCHGVLSISQATSGDVRTVLKNAKLKVPILDHFRLGDEVIRNSKLEKPQDIQGAFILSVGTIEVRKNHMILYYAYRSLIDAGVELPKLIIAGKRGTLTSDFQFIIEHDEKVNSRIKIIDNANDSELCWLYKNCQYTVFPSFAEGWGLPIAESLSYGKVTISSNTSSMPEIGGKLVDYISPYSTDDLQKWLLYYNDSNNILKRSNEIQKGFKILNWNDATSQFADKVSRIISAQ